MALVVMGKWIAQQHVPNLWRPLKQVKPNPPTTLMTAGRSEPAGRNSPDYAGVFQYTIWLVEETWPTPPHLHHIENPVLSPTAKHMTPSTWDGKPTLHKRAVTSQRLSGTMSITPTILTIHIISTTMG
jgi:hypothetical protein